MMKNNIILPKIISISLFVVIFISCSTSRNKLATPETEVVKCIDDFIVNYPKLNTNKELTSLLFLKVTENNNMYYRIMDKPRNGVLGTLKEIEKNNSQSAVGVYKEILCEYKIKDFKGENLNFEMVSKSIIDKAITGRTFTYDSIVYNIPYGDLEWEPTVEVDYDFKSKKKKIRVLGKEEIKTQSFN